MAPVWKAENYPEGGGRTQSHEEFRVEAQGLTEAEMGPVVRNQALGKARKRQRQMESWGRVRLREPER